MRNMMAAVPRAVASTALLAAVFAVGVLASIAPAAAAEPARAAFDARDQVISAFCGGYPGASSCKDWQINRSAWSDERYQSFYRDHRYEEGMSTPAAVAAFGPTPGRMAPIQDVGARTLENAAPRVEVIGDSDNHVDDCRAAFRSYDIHTDSYMANDGTRHKCKL
jgi:hypothetical protein